MKLMRKTQELNAKVYFLYPTQYLVRIIIKNFFFFFWKYRVSDTFSV